MMYFCIFYFLIIVLHFSFPLLVLGNYKYLTLREGIQNYLQDNYPDFLNDILLADGFEEAFMGVAESFDNVPRAC